MHIKMEIVETPAEYVPHLDHDGTYVDRVPLVVSQIGIKCGCGTKTIFTTRNSMITHTLTKRHKAWLMDVNNNKTNYYSECVKSAKTIKTQQIMIAKLEKEVRTKSKTIDLLTEQINKAADDAINMDIDDLLDL
jgi:hypothetical protein